MLLADFGAVTTEKLIQDLTDEATRDQLDNAEDLYLILKKNLANILNKSNKKFELAATGTTVVLMVGVNGAGKTTTIGKLANKFQQQGKTVALAAGDTFRAAATEQLEVWGERNGVHVISQHQGADSASVLYDAYNSCLAKNIDVLLADTAGRLQNKINLMNELEKIARVLGKLNPDAPHEVILTLDATTGQNAISQANLFNNSVKLTGLILTKLDGTAKGGVIFNIKDNFDLPIYYIGVGEGVDDLQDFDSNQFIDALFDNQQEGS